MAFLFPENALNNQSVKVSPVSSLALHVWMIGMVGEWKVEYGALIS